MPDHNHWMQRALALARRAQGYTSPNPMVGAVIVRDGHVLGEGYHQQAGMPHAEIEALHAVSGSAEGATLYITLEPCNHYGRTPPCTEAILAAGITHVIYAIPDPNPHASGGGQRLRGAGVQVTVGVCAEAAAHLNRFFLHYIRTSRPYVIAKYAMSLDGKLATHTGHSQWITGEAARLRAHELRHAVDALLVGRHTVMMDNPRLTTRLPIDNPRHPLRVILDSKGQIPLQKHIFQAELPGQTLVDTSAAMPAAHEQVLAERGVAVLRLPMHHHSQQLDLLALLDALGQRGVQSLLVEGGSTVFGAFFDAGLVDEVWAFIAPVMIGGADAPSPVSGAGAETMMQALRLRDIQVERLEADLLICGKIDSSIVEGD